LQNMTVTILPLNYWNRVFTKTLVAIKQHGKFF
jgi:hypothetical protein